MIKDELRAQMRAKRRSLTTEQVSDFSADIKKKLFSLPCMQSPCGVCTFLSAFKEPDTMPIVSLLEERGYKIAVPISHTETNTLTLSYINGTDSLVKGAYGIYEPAAAVHADASDMDVILVPGLAFDIHGNRMGFGKGYYDRLLCGMRAVKIGLCYDFQLHASIPSDAHDIPMDYIITEKEILEIR